jgi:hypothetical protein
LSAAQDHGLKWIMKYNIPEQDWIDYAKAIEDDYNNDIPSNPLGEDFLPFRQYFFDYHTGCREDIESIMDTFDKLFHPKHHRHAANKIADWWINVKEQRRIRAANKISEWFLDCKYNPKYKYCKDRIWKEFQEIQIGIIEEEEEEEIKKEFKYPRRCRKIDGEWKQYLGAGQYCDPEYEEEEEEEYEEEEEEEIKYCWWDGCILTNLDAPPSHHYGIEDIDYCIDNIKEKGWAGEGSITQITYRKRRNDCVCMGCPNESVVFQELDCPDNSITGDGKDWYCAKCYKECVDDEYEL